MKQLIEIKNRFTDEIIVSGKYMDLKEAVEENKAYLSGAYLFRANLSGANLSGADLFAANLSGANLSKADLSGAKRPPVMSHDFIAEILSREADGEMKYLKYIGLIVLVREWCWDEFLEKLPKSFINWAKKILCDKWEEFEPHFK